MCVALMYLCIQWYARTWVEAVVPRLTASLCEAFNLRPIEMSADQHLPAIDGGIYALVPSEQERSTSDIAPYRIHIDLSSSL
jgi:hypothetical protein